MTQASLSFQTGAEVKQEGFIGGETLASAWKYQEKIDQLKKEIKGLETELEGLQAAQDRIIDQYVASGKFEEDIYYIKAGKQPTRFDSDLLREKYPEVYKTLFERFGREKFSVSKEMAEGNTDLTSHQIEMCCKEKGRPRHKLEIDLHKVVVNQRQSKDMPEQNTGVEV